MMADEIMDAMQADDHINALTAYMINNRPSNRLEVKGEIQSCWPFQNDIAVVGGIAMEGRRIIAQQ